MVIEWCNLANGLCTPGKFKSTGGLAQSALENIKPEKRKIKET